MSARPEHMHDRDLVDSVRRLVDTDHGITLDLLERLGEVDARKLYRVEACSSMYSWCTERLGLESGASARRIRSARMIRRYPLAHELSRTRKLGLAALADLTPYVTPENQEELLRSSAGLSTRAHHELLAARFPQPERPPSSS